METVQARALSDTILARIARVAHEANRAYCDTIGDPPQLSWDSAPAWQRTSAIEGVRFLAYNRGAWPEECHENWMRDKERDGWKHGVVKDPEAKTHPCMVPYANLPKAQRAKDTLFHAVVRALLDQYE